MTIWKDGGGDDEWFERVYRAHFARIWRYFRACRVSDDEAHDLAQETFKRFYEHLSQFRGDDKSVLSFLQTTARHILLNYIRDHKTQKRNAPLVDIDDPEVHEELAAPEEPDYADRQHHAMRRTQLKQAVAALSVGQQQVLRLLFDGLKYAQIAEALQISVDAVKSRLRDAKKQLRVQLGENQ